MICGGNHPKTTCRAGKKGKGGKKGTGKGVKGGKKGAKQTGKPKKTVVKVHG